MSDTQIVTLARHENIGLILIDRPPVNAIDRSIRAGLIRAVDEAEGDASIDIIVIACKGRTFLSGADLSEFDGGIPEPGYREVMARLESARKPVVAAIHGTALGGGLEVALACHYRVAVPSAKLGLPEITLGVLPGAGGTQRLPRLVGPAEALKMMLTGAPVTVGEAVRIGLIDRILDTDPIEAGLAYARELLALRAAPRPTRDRVANGGGLDAAIVAQLQASAKSLAGRTTQDAFVEAVKAAVALPFERGLDKEHELAMRAVATAESRALRHAFFAERATGKVPGVPKDIRPIAVKSVAVIGAGTMGSGIAMAFGNAGFDVTLIDAKSDGLERGRNIIRSTYEGNVKRGRMTDQVAAEHIARIKPTLEIGTVAHADLVVEAVFEDMALKKRVLGEISRIAPPHAIIASNTSSLSVEELAAATDRPDRVIGLHFFSPAHVMRLLEIVRAPATSAETLLTGLDIARRIKKIGVVSGDGFGFIGNRMMLDGYFREAEQLLLEGAEPAQIDAAMERFGFAMGPFRVTDMGGVDIGTSVREQLFLRETRQDPYFAVSDKLTSLGRLGQKTGRGFYTYDPGDRTGRPDPELTGIIAELAAERGIARRTIGDDEIEERCVLQLVNIGADIIADDIAYRAGDIDVVWLAGYGFPRHLGGPMCYADLRGLPQILDRIRHYHAAHGHYWKPSPLLEQLVADGRSFADDPLAQAA